MSHTLKNYAKLLEEGYDYNVVMKIGQEPDFKIFNAHSIILRAQSPYFHRALSEEWRREEDGKILFEKPNVTPKIFEFIIKYIYSGDTSLDNFDFGELTDIIIASDEFILPELVDCIEDKLLSSTDILLTKYFVKIFKFFSRQEFCCKKLGKFCNKARILNPSIILRSEDFTLLDEEMLIEFLKLEFHGMKETEVWDRLIQWGKAQNPSIAFDENSGAWTEEKFSVLKETLGQCVTHIKYPLFTSDEFFNHVKPYKKIFHPDYYEDLLWKNFVKKENNEPLKYSSVVSNSNNRIYLHNFPKIGEPSVQRQIDNSENNERIDSEIIGNEHLSVICRSIGRMMGKSCNNFNLLMNSKNEGFSSQVFSRICDEIRSTLILLTVEGTDEIIGGYSPLKWGSKGECWKQTGQSFIFSFPNGDHSNYRYSAPSDDKKAIYRNGTNGPNFGGNDLAVGQGYSLKKDAICIQTNYSRPIRDDSGYFRVESFEIYEVEFI